MFLEQVSKLSWWDVYACDDTDKAVHIFTTKLGDILDKMAPVKKFQIRTKYAAWVRNETKLKIVDRDMAQQIASESGADEDWERYKRLRNDVTNQLKKDKKTWQEGKLSSCQESKDTGKLWKSVLGWLNWSSSSSPTKLLHQGNLVTSPG